MRENARPLHCVIDPFGPTVQVVNPPTGGGATGVKKKCVARPTDPPGPAMALTTYGESCRSTFVRSAWPEPGVEIPARL